MLFRCLKTEVVTGPVWCAGNEGEAGKHVTAVRTHGGNSCVALQAGGPRETAARRYGRKQNVVSCVTGVLRV